MKKSLSALLLAFGFVAVVSQMAANAAVPAQDALNLFQASEISTGTLVAGHHGEGGCHACGEGSCGEDDKGDHACGEGSCGNEHKNHDDEDHDDHK